MGIHLTEEEKQLIQEGKLDPSNIEEHRKTNPVKPVNLNEVDDIKQKIREVNGQYRESIQKNKDLYNELVENRKKKAELRDKLAELRLEKKKILGLI